MTSLHGLQPLASKISQDPPPRFVETRTHGKNQYLLDLEKEDLDEVFDWDPTMERHHLVAEKPIGHLHICMVITYFNMSKDQPAKVAQPARAQLNREINFSFSLSPFAHENLVSRDGFGSPVPR